MNDPATGAPVRRLRDTPDVGGVVRALDGAAEEGGEHVRG